MKRIMAVMGGIVLLSGTGAAVSRNPDPQADSAAGAASRGAAAWAENCGGCHNVRSPGEMGDSQWLVASTHMRVRANLPGDMTRDIVAFLQASNDGMAGPAPTAPAIPAAQAADAPAASAPTASAPPPAASAAPPGDPVNGGRIYAQTCVACHGRDGAGVLPGMPDLRAPGGRLSQSDSALLRNMINGIQSPGSPMPMPARGGNPNLTDQDMADVLAYLRATFERR